jgi:hypothetical protein
MGARAPNIFYYRVMDMHSFPRGLNLLCILGLRLAVGINSSFLAQLGCRTAVLLAWALPRSCPSLRSVRQRQSNCEAYDVWRAALARCQATDIL